MIVSEIETQIEKVRFDAGLAFDEVLLKSTWGEPIGASAQRIISTCEARPYKSSETFGEAYQRYLSDPTHSWSLRTREVYETSRRLAVSVIGAGTMIGAISRAHCRDYLEVLRFLPRNSAKRFPKLTAKEAS